MSGPRQRIGNPPPEVRCTATIKLKDGSTAQCGRREAMDGLGKCWQHQRIHFRSDNT